MFVIDSPSVVDDKRGTLASDRSGELLQRVLEVKMAGYGWYVTSAVRCTPGPKANGTGLKDTKIGEVAACKTYLDDEIRELQPRLIVAMGKAAMHAATGLPVGKCAPTKAAGMFFESEWGIPVMPMHSHRWASASPEVNLAIWEPLWDRIRDKLGGQVEEMPGSYEFLTEKADIVAWYEHAIKKAKNPTERLSFDYETTGFSPRTDAFRMVGYAWNGLEATVIPMIERWQQELHRQLIKACHTTVVHNLLFEMQWYYQRFGEFPKGLVVDTKCLGFLENENRSKRLGDMVSTFVPMYAGFKGESETADEEINELPDHILARRCAYDVMSTFLLAERLEELITPEQQDLYVDVIEPSMKTVAACMIRGLKVDENELAFQMQEREREMAEAQAAVDADPTIQAFLEEERKRLKVIRKPDFNINSVPMKQRYMRFIGLRPSSVDDVPDSRKKLVQWGKAKLQDEEMGTSKDVLEPYVGTYPILAEFIKFTAARHEKSHFLAATATFMTEEGFLHPGYNWGGQVRPGQAKGTVTGRLSSAEPNVMNPPKWFRKCFVSRFKGGSIVSADYSQLEMRIAAVGCPEPVWEQAFRSGEDLHQSGADRMNVERSVCKTINYGKMYGAGPGKLAGEAGRTVQWAKDQFAKWDREHAGFTAFINATRAAAVEDGEVAGFFAQRLHTPDGMTDDKWARTHAMNRAGNFPFQNAAGYITLDAMWLIEYNLRKAGLEAIVIGQMHDAIYVDAPAHEVDKVKEIMRDCMVTMQHKRWPWLRGILEIDFTVGRTMAGNPLVKED